MDKKQILTANSGLWSYNFQRCELTASFTDADGQLIALKTDTNSEHNVNVTVQRQTPAGKLRTWLQGYVPRRTEGAKMSEDLISLTFEDSGKYFEAVILFQTRELRLSEVFPEVPPTVKTVRYENDYPLRGNDGERTV